MYICTSYTVCIMLVDLNIVILYSPYFNPILEAYLEEDETVDAEVYVNKAAPIMYNIDDSPSLQLR